MITFDEFEKHLHDALVHLYDPLYQPPDFLYNLISSSGASQLSSPKPTQPSEQSRQFQQTMIAAIAHLQPGADVPLKARSRRMYELLASRYVQELTQEETAERLGITPRHLRREQQQAVLMLAQQLWNEYTQARALPHKLRGEHPVMQQPVTTGVANGKPDAGKVAFDLEDALGLDAAWRVQVQQEVAALQQSDPNTVAEIGAILEHVRQLENRLAESGGVTIGVQFMHA